MPTYCRACEIRDQHIDKLKAELANCDTRFRPMDKAPRDGTVVEIETAAYLSAYNRAVFVWWDAEVSGWQLHSEPAGSVGWIRPTDAVQWRNAHPDWQADSGEETG